MFVIRYNGAIVRVGLHICAFSEVRKMLLYFLKSVRFLRSTTFYFMGFAHLGFGFAKTLAAIGIGRFVILFWGNGA